MFAVDDPTVAAVTGNIEQVGVLGGKAYLIAAGLALAGVAIGFIRKAKRQAVQGGERGHLRSPPTLFQNPTLKTMSYGNANFLRWSRVWLLALACLGWSVVNKCKAADLELRNPSGTYAKVTLTYAVFVSGSQWNVTTDYEAKGVRPVDAQGRSKLTLKVYATGDTVTPPLSMAYWLSKEIPYTPPPGSSSSFSSSSSSSSSIRALGVELASEQACESRTSRPRNTRNGHNGTA